jgi:hypothetical protein
VSEEGGDGGAARSEMPSLLSYTLRYVSFAEVGRVCQVALREPFRFKVVYYESMKRKLQILEVCSFFFAP